MNHTRYYLTVLLCTLVLTACGGGGSGSSSAPGTTTPASPTSPTAPTSPTSPTAVSLSISGKSLDFSWTASSNVDHYRILVNPDGASGFSVAPSAANIANTATSHSLVIAVHKTNWLAAQYILEACDAAETSCAAAPNQTLALIDSVAATVYVKASNTDIADQFGFAVALSGDGNTLVVGGRLESSAATGINGNQADNTASAAGAVYVFTRIGNTWVQQAYVKASNTGTDDNFGFSVTLSDDGNTLAVGAADIGPGASDQSGEDSAATGINNDETSNGASDSGAVYVFTRSGTIWTQQAYVKASNTGADDQFGVSVALSSDGNTLAVGAIFEDSAATDIDGNQADNTALSSGAVYVFTRSGSTWTQQAYVKASNTGANDSFGFSVTMSDDGNTLAVGAAFRENSGGVRRGESSTATGINGDQANNGATKSGAVYVFTRSGITWTQQAYVKASNTGVDDLFGIAVALSGDGNTLAVGADSEKSNATGIDGNQADNSILIAPFGAGAVYVFTRSANTWTQQAYVKASNTGADQFGKSVVLSTDGNILAVGADIERSFATGIGGDQTDDTAFIDVVGAGAVYVFTRTGATWAQQAYVKASNTGAPDSFGTSIGLSGDGNTLAVGADTEQSNATGIGGDQANDSASSGAGAVYLY